MSCHFANLTFRFPRCCSFGIGWDERPEDREELRRELYCVLKSVMGSSPSGSVMTILCPEGRVIMTGPRCSTPGSNDQPVDCKIRGGFPAAIQSSWWGSVAIFQFEWILV